MGARGLTQVPPTPTELMDNPLVPPLFFFYVDKKKNVKDLLIVF